MEWNFGMLNLLRMPSSMKTFLFSCIADYALSIFSREDSVWTSKQAYKMKSTIVRTACITRWSTVPAITPKKIFSIFLYSFPVHCETKVIPFLKWQRVGCHVMLLKRRSTSSLPPSTTSVHQLTKWSLKIPLWSWWWISGVKHWNMSVWDRLGSLVVNLDWQMPSVLGLLPAASISPLSSFGLVDPTMPANHVHSAAPSIAGTGFPYSRRQGTALDSLRCMLQGWDTFCVPIHRHIPFPFLPYPPSSAVPATIPCTDGTTGSRHWPFSSLCSIQALWLVSTLSAWSPEQMGDVGSSCLCSRLWDRQAMLACRCWRPWAGSCRLQGWWAIL